MRNDHAISRRAFLAGLGSIPVLLSVPGTGYAASSPLVTVTKDPNCGCCTGWAEHIEAAGFPVRIVESQNMDAIKQRLGVPPALYSCHTAEVDGYVVEGHVPAAAIQRLLTERPAATGLAVPGMPAGSPGMDFPGMTAEPYEVFLFTPADHKIFGQFRGAQEV
ncbi:DUF411 domain-containing protein [Tianweitania sediminis]|uniref:DUF411 domain-containing protein n=1 Tax=Tianweitania sediminis TaxID=1502156 RepID=A0A8J7R138_9HYPH|nr:DUF411 domain-containing protein [Tianweitania sediminis]MBP0440135.1 DUF411 domain-containing protein [Tianweitania sediminis]MCO5157102.1 DUF411 domain-containing protein [Aquamicrobium sp.]